MLTKQWRHPFCKTKSTCVEENAKIKVQKCRNCSVELLPLFSSSIYRLLTSCQVQYQHHIARNMSRIGSNAAGNPVGVSNSARGVWLVKVPKFVAAQWNANKGKRVGQLTIKKQSGIAKADVTFQMSSDLVQDKSAELQKSAPQKFKMNLSVDKDQHLYIASRAAADVGNDDTDMPTGEGPKENLDIVGLVQQRGEFRAQHSTDQQLSRYLQLKSAQMVAESKPSREVLQLDKVPTNIYKPISAHSYQKEFERRKKEEGRHTRADKNQVMDIVFAAFEKHQYYALADLQKLTKQPVVYLKEVLKEIGIYNLKNPHRHMWELKPEYSHTKEMGTSSMST